jgi:Spy/CpxP family protein refolding chaperone
MEFAKWQWDLQAVTEEMEGLVSKDKIEETKAMSTLETMLDMERNIKRTQLRLMIKIKNQLTTAQQEKLRELIDQNRFRFRDFDSTSPAVFPRGQVKKNDE